MACFLTHLVQRTLAASPALAPRLAGRYESRREALHPPLDPDVQSAPESALPVQARVREQTQARTPAAPAEREVRARPVPLVDAGERAHETESTPALVVHASAEAPEPSLVHEAHEPAAASFPDGHAAAPPVRRAPATQPTDETSVGRTRNAVPDVAPLQPAALQPQPAPRPEPPLHDRGANATHRVARPDVRPAPVPDESTSRSSTVPPIGLPVRDEARALHWGMLVEPRVAGDGAGPREPQQAPAAPTVHVTIGRIELRAAAPAPAPARQPAKAPTLSLSDYLERRAKAGAP